jgi:very-short-patch-repair endonuclease
MKTDIQRDRASTLRKNQTVAELKLRRCLRRRGVGGFRFHRQVEIGPYIVDFLCRERRLIIEVDGATHGDATNVRYDTRRTDFLRSLGYVVCRVDNVDVYENITGVLDGILIALEELEPTFKSQRG